MDNKTKIQTPLIHLHLHNHKNSKPKLNSTAKKTVEEEKNKPDGGDFNEVKQVSFQYTVGLSGFFGVFGFVMRTNFVCFGPCESRELNEQFYCHTLRITDAEEAMGG